MFQEAPSVRENVRGSITYASFILAAKFFWHLIDYGLNARIASEINEQIRKRRLKQKT